MSDLDSLIVTFQTQLSDVMETVVKTAMFEVTRLVEEGFMEEMRRRGQQVETLRMQLQWTEKKMSDQEAQKKTGRCVQCFKKDAELSVDSSEERSDDQHEDELRSCGVKREGTPVERWTQGHREEVTSELPQEADVPKAASSPERGSQVPEEQDMVSAVDVKEEQTTQLSFSSVHLGGWSDTLDGTGGVGAQNASEKSKAQQKQTQENSEELLRNIMKQSSQIPSAFGFPEEREKTRVASEPPHLSALDTGWTGLPQNHRHVAEKTLDSAQTRASLQLADHRMSDSAAADVHAQVACDATSVSSKATLQNIEALGVTIKQEATDDSDGCEEREPLGKKDSRKSGMRSVSCSAKQHRLSSEPHKQNHLSHKATVQEVMKLHSKAGSSFRTQAAIQHLHRPMKRAPHTLSNSSTAAALSSAHSQVINLNPLNRIPSTSKTAAPPPLSVQRVHLGDKQAAALNRSAAQWVGIRSLHQSVNSHHANPAAHADSGSGPRHLLRCGQCGKCFPHPSNLKAHLQTHSGERPFCCSLCGRSFTKLSNLKAHRRVHTGERPYCCLACGKRFTQKCNLKRHQRIHLDI